MPPEPSAVTPRDIFLAAHLSAEAAAGFLEQRGLRDGGAADEHLQQLADDLSSRLALGNLANLLLDTLATTPDPDAAVVGFCRYVATRTPQAAFIGNLHADPRMLEILTQILGTSPFLSEILIRNPEYLHWLRRELDSPPPDRATYDAEIDRRLDGTQSVENQVNALKRFQRREVLRVAARDLFGMLNRETLTTTTTQLSNLADALVDGVLRLASAEHAARHGPLPGRFAVIGMGKLGGVDLNYSSDIDLIYIYDVPVEAAGDAHHRYQRLGRRLTTLLSEHTAEGYLYRVDMRLRPMGARGNLVYSLQQSAQYYENLGETFERFALLKARPIAGDRALGRKFVERVAPFVYRKYLDHAAIEELARYKARADREHARHGDLDRNVKEGRGGIREIELFAQVFLLLYGGDQPALRTGHTLTALEQLGSHGFIEPDVQQDLAAAYIFLRNIEHGLQVAEGQQTHSLSGTERGLRALARRLGFDELATLEGVLHQHRDRVHAVYARLFEEQTEDGNVAGREFFRLLAGEMNDDDARALLLAAGFAEPDSALNAMRALDAAARGGRSSARNLLANLLGMVTSGAASLSAPGTVLIRLERVVAASGAAAALYRTLLEDRLLRERLLAGLDAGDLFAARLAAYPELLDSLARGVLDPEPFQADVAAAFDEVVANGADIRSRLDPFRRVKAIEEFKVLVEWLTVRRLDLLTDKLSLVADCAVRAAARAVARNLPPTPDTANVDGGWDRVRPGQARQPGADGALRPRPRLRLRGRPRRRAPLRAPPEIRAHRSGSVVQNDGRGFGVQDRHAAAPGGPDGSTGDSAGRLRTVSARARRNLGADGVDALAGGRRRCRLGRAGPTGCRRFRIRTVVGRHSGVRAARPGAHRTRAGQGGRRRAARPQTRPRRPGRYRLPAPGAADQGGPDAGGIPRRRHAAPARGTA